MIDAYGVDSITEDFPPSKGSIVSTRTLKPLALKHSPGEVFSAVCRSRNLAQKQTYNVLFHEAYLRDKELKEEGDKLLEEVRKMIKDKGLLEKSTTLLEETRKMISRDKENGA